MSNFNPTNYKQNSKANWNIIAPQYHNNWASDHIGPFRSTFEVVRQARIEPSDKVLDLACGTGALSKQVRPKLGEEGTLVCVDFSRTALNIARHSVNSPMANFFEMDAENIGFRLSFDKILCQYALMFFPDADRVLKSAKSMLGRCGRIVVAVHGKAEEVPYFSAIMEPVLRYIPDIRPQGAPNVHRFGNPEDLQNELCKAGFSDIKIHGHVFEYDAGSFEDYWTDYLKSTAYSISSKITGSEHASEIKKKSEENVSAYVKRGRIVFPWKVLIGTAS